MVRNQVGSHCLLPEQDDAKAPVALLLTKMLTNPMLLAEMLSNLMLLTEMLTNPMLLFLQALKMFHHTFKHFEDMGEDQFDFHTYCLRKMTLRSYVEMLRMEDSLLHHIHFSKAAWGAIETYLQLTEAPKRQAQVRSRM